MNSGNFLSIALGRLPAAHWDRALDVCPAGPASIELGCRFNAVQTAPPNALMSLADAGLFDFVLAERAFDGGGHHLPAVVNCFRESARLLREGGLLCARIDDLPGSPTHLPAGELAEMARDLDFQILSIDGAATRSMWILLRKRASGWRLDLAERAALATAQIRRIANAWDGGPVVPVRGRYAAIDIWVEGLPSDMDLLDLEVLIGGSRSTAVSIGEPDGRGWQEIEAVLPYLEQTGLVPVELRWFGERLTPETAYLRAIPPGPSVPRITEVSNRPQGPGIAIVMEELGRPNELTATIGGQTLWADDLVCTDPVSQRYELLFQLPENLKPGSHEIQLTAGSWILPPVAVEIE